MKALVTISMVALLAVAATTPASAQYGGGWGYGGGNFRGSINSTQAQLQARINQGIASGRLSRQEAARLQNKLAQVAALEARMRASGARLTWNERNKLNKQLSNLNVQITRELNDFENRRIGNRNRGWYR
jgi:hypothetical protein